MSQDHSFDISSEINLQEVDNALNQTLKEVNQRYDLKASGPEIKRQEKESLLKLSASNEYTLKAIIEILKQRFVKRNLSLKSFRFDTIELVGAGRAKIDVPIQQGLSTEQSKIVMKDIKTYKGKINASIQGDQIRAVSKKIDDLQGLMSHLKSKSYDFHFSFNNFR